MIEFLRLILLFVVLPPLLGAVTGELAGDVFLRWWRARNDGGSGDV